MSGARAVILVCRGETFDPSPSFKINIAETVSGKERKCCSKMILSVTVRGRHVSFLIGIMTKQGFPPPAASLKALYVHHVGSIPSAAGQTRGYCWWIEGKVLARDQKSPIRAEGSLCIQRRVQCHVISILGF